MACTMIVGLQVQKCGFWNFHLFHPRLLVACPLDCLATTHARLEGQHSCSKWEIDYHFLKMFQTWVIYFLFFHPMYEFCHESSSLVFGLHVFGMLEFLYTYMEPIAIIFFPISICSMYLLWHRSGLLVFLLQVSKSKDFAIPNRWFHLAHAHLYSMIWVAFTNGHLNIFRMFPLWLQ